MPDVLPAKRDQTAPGRRAPTAAPAPEAVFVAERASRDRGVKIAAAGIAGFAALWLAAVLAGMLGFRPLPDLPLVSEPAPQVAGAQGHERPSPPVAGASARMGDDLGASPDSLLSAARATGSAGLEGSGPAAGGRSGPSQGSPGPSQGSPSPSPGGGDGSGAVAPQPGVPPPATDRGGGSGRPAQPGGSGGQPAQSRGSAPPANDAAAPHGGEGRRDQGRRDQAPGQAL